MGIVNSRRRMKFEIVFEKNEYGVRRNNHSVLEVNKPGRNPDRISLPPPLRKKDNGPW